MQSFCIYAQEPTDLIYHTVEGAENVYRISLLYKIPMDSLKQWNNLDDYYTVTVGQRLIVSKKERDILTTIDPKPDTLDNIPQKTFLSLYSEPEPVIIKRKKPLKEKILFYYQNSNIFYRIVIFINMFFIFSSIVLSIIVITRRIYELGIKFKINKCREKYRDFITEWLYEEDTESIPEYLNKELKHRVNREVFTSELLSLHSNLIGESAKKLIELYHFAGLKKYSVKKIYSMFWHIKAKGFRELAQMKITEGNELIYKYLNSKNDVLRLEAQLAWIQLNPDNPDGFYDYPNVQITKWGQLNSLEAFKKIGIIPDFSKWLQNSNKNITIFALKMTGIFKQFGSANVVSILLHDKDSEIRQEAICTLGKMEMASSIDELQNLYSTEDLINKTEIVRALIMISDSTNIGFFKYLLLNETDTNLRILSAKGLVLLGDNGKEILNTIFIEADPFLKKIINHAKCEE